MPGYAAAPTLNFHPTPYTITTFARSVRSVFTLSSFTRALVGTVGRDFLGMTACHLQALHLAFTPCNHN
jgi:hypothetical protein